MDRNSIIGIVLIAAVIITFGIATRPSKQEQEDQKRRRDSLIQVEQERIIEEAKRNLALDSVQKNIPENIVTEQVLTENETGQYGDFARSAAGEQEFYTIENNLLKLKLSTRGGRPYSVELKDYKTWDDQPLLLFDGDSTRFGLNFYSNNRSIATNNLFFQSTNNNKNIVIDRTPKSISMRLYAGEGNKHYIEYIYYLEPDSYKVGFQIKMEGMDQIMRSDSKIELDWEQKIRAAEKGRSNEIRYTNIFYKHFEDKVDKLGMRSKEENIPTKLKWVGFNQQFFSSVLIADNSFNNAQLKSEIIEYDSDYLKKFSAKISIPINGTDNQTLPMNFYYGPNHYKTLTTYGDDLNELVDLGWRFISWINKWFVINIFHFLEGKIASYGLIILLLTIFFKLLLFPLTLKSYKSSAKMRVLKPEIEVINKKYGKDKAMEKQKATMALYKRAGVNPMGGCLPMLLQMPVFLALFRFFPASIELRQKAFLWATDLSSFDSIIDLPFKIPAYGDHISLFTLLMAGSMFLTTKMNSSQMETSGQMPGMKMMMYFMPVMMLLWFNNYASGLCYYYFISNLITFGQMMMAKRLVDEKAILQKLHENKKKPVKKSKFQARLEEMQKQQQKRKR